MNTAAIYIRTQPEVKAKAEKLARNLGLSLSTLLDTWLRQFAKTRKVTFSAKEEKPSKYLIDSIKKSEEQLKKGETSPAFDNAKDAIDWLEKQGI